jgi:hypothetical protein
MARKKKNELSKNTLIMLGLIAFVVSMFSTVALLSPGGITGFVTQQIGSANVTVKGAVAITLPTAQVVFRNEADETNNTLNATAGPEPITVKNDGNVNVDVNLTWGADYSGFWAGTSAATDLQWGCAYVGQNASQCNNKSWMDDVNTTNFQAVNALNYSDTNDTVHIHVRIHVPSDETPGKKNTTITIDATEV